MDFNCKQSLIEVSLRDIRDAIDQAKYHVNSKVIDLLNDKNLVITCYGSDARLDKWNRGEGTIDLLLLNKDEFISSDEIRDLIIDFIEKTKDLVEDNSYIEVQDDGEIYTIQDEIQVGKEISQLQKNNYYIDILNFSDKLYKYENKTYPDRLIDAYNINGDFQTFWEFKQKMLDDIISKSSILKDFKQDVKPYFKEETIRGKNIRKGFKNHFNFDLGKDFGILRYDKQSYFGFKHGPMRALQYKIIEKFISFVVEKKDSSLIKNFPFSIEERLIYFRNNKLKNSLSNDDYLELIELYKFFRELNEKIHNMTISKKYTNNIFYIEEIDAFIFNGIEYNKIIKKLNKFIDLFNKI